MQKVNPVEYIVTKSTVQLYKLRHPSGMYWADITIDDQGRAGRIQIASDWGSWQNYWGASGPSFKLFLSKINIHYAAEKFGCGHWFNHTATIESFKRSVISSRREEGIDGVQARELWDEIKELEDVDDEQIFYMRVYESEVLYEHFDYHPDVVKDVDPNFRSFWDTVWPALLNEFRLEFESQTVIPFT